LVFIHLFCKTESLAQSFYDYVSPTVLSSDEFALEVSSVFSVVITDGLKNPIVNTGKKTKDLGSTFRYHNHSQFIDYQSKSHFASSQAEELPQPSNISASGKLGAVNDAIGSADRLSLILGVEIYWSVLFVANA
jgi:hypothetical protein